MTKLIFNKMRKRILFSKYTGVFALTLTSLFSAAQTTVTVGTATTTTNNAPINAANAFHYSQCIYKASDIIAAGGTGAGTISKIRYYLGSGTPNANSAGWTVYLGHTNKVNFNSTTDWISATGLTTCFSGTVTFPAAGNWMEIILTTPFNWNGIDNIVVGVDENQAGSGSTSFWRYTGYGSDNRTIYYSNNATNPNPAAPPTASSRGTWAPNIQFEWTAIAPCSGTPAHTTATVDDGSICPGQAVHFGLAGLTFNSGFDFEWQYNDGSGWQSYPSSDTTNFAVVPTTTVNVRAIVTCSNSAAQDTSDEISVVVNPNPVVTVNTASVAYCAGDNVQLIAADTSSTTTFAWLPITGLNVANNDTVAANPATPTTYTVTGTNSFGCTSTATASVAPLSMVTRAATYTPNQICAPGSPVAITTTVTPALINGGSTWEYRFLDNDGVELQTWNSSSTLNYIPAADSVYTIYYQVRSNGCADEVDSLPLNVVVGFGAATNIVGYDCNNLGGTVSLNSIFGQTTTETVYTNPLANATTDITNLTFNGSAAITGGRAVLTPSATGSNGSVTINDPAFHTGLNNAMTVSFKMTADQPINTYGTGGADGISYSFGDDVAATGNPNGTGSKLRLSFDAADNSPNVTGIYLTYGFASGTMAPGNATTLVYNNNSSLWKIKQDVQVVLTINTSGKASLTLDGTTVFENIQMPAAYMNASTTGWKHVFGAATGGDAMRQAVSDLVITAPSLQFALTDENVAPATWVGTSTFTNIQPGTYDVWISTNGSTSCAKKVETIEIENLNPLVELGNDTTICEGESLILDAGNAGSSYVWSNSQVTTQTHEVMQAGHYVVNVINTDGCVGVGSINIDVMGAPTASSIFVVNNMPTYTFTILNPQNADEYSWDFGDGSTLSNAPGTVSHTYLTAGPRQVSVTLTNECGTETVVTTIVVTSTAGIEEQGIEGLSVFPNPASDNLTIVIPQSMDASATVYSATGSLVTTIAKLDAQTELSVQNWNPGVYFVRIQNDEKTSTIKLVIQ
ncbi:T9SS type A sorting domain-containing protein [Fluviicola sp.]|uniref:T9SS type A sorting domain-containing protein n=1 Tax=Fluviicola sp. TaxID=1917219 RepID=UPI003D2A715F